MVPLKLQIKNFVSYGPTLQTINFEPYQLICFSGKNGHGKSALLDAITWAIWGQARKVSGTVKADEGLLRLGQTNMVVALDFNCNGQTYRIKREYTQMASKAQTELEFGILDIKTQTLRPLTDKTIKTTQEKINSMLGLDYESFINSGFLKQGQSNEFSKKTPKERKEILANILRLDQFEELKKRANEKSKEASIQKEQLAQVYQRLNSDVLQKEFVENNLLNLEKALWQIGEKEQIMLTENNKLKTELEKINQEKISVERSFLKIEQLDINIQEQSKLFYQIANVWRSIFHKNLNLNNFSNLIDEKNRLENLLQQKQTASHKYIEFKELLSNLKIKESQIVQAFQNEQRNFIDKLNINKQEIESSIKFLNKTKIDQKNRLENLITEQKRNQIEFNQIKIENIPATQIIDKEKFLEKNKIFFQKWHAKYQFILNELKSFSQKKDLVKDNSKPLCPLCFQGLEKSHQDNLLEKFCDQELLLKSQATKIHKALSNIKNRISNLTLELDILKKSEEESQKNIIRREEINKTIEKNIIQIGELETLCKDADCNINKQNEQLSSVMQEIEQYLATATLKNNIEYQTLIGEISIIQEKLDKLNYNQEEEQKIKTLLQKIYQEEKEHTALINSLGLQEERKQQILQISKYIKQLKLEKKSLKSDALVFERIITSEKDILSKEAVLKLEYRILLEEKEKLILQKGALDQQFKIIKEKEKELYELTIKIKQFQQIQEEYQIIASALGKDGIQALLIEDAIPEIEYEANKLLSKLTDNQSQLTIDSLKDLKSGSTRETLDIKISDAVGIGAYELFSGGEAFRIDFALRIAIAKLLARRAGTSLETLIIDEGFGSQDEEGLSNIMDALHKIQTDFSKIIIVSHLPSMKDQFPVHFYINKGPEGSCVKVIEQA